MFEWFERNFWEVVSSLGIVAFSLVLIFLLKKKGDAILTDRKEE